MINAAMRFYDYFTYGDDDGYGQPSLSSQPKGKVKMTINLSSQTTQDNINYENCNYVGLTHDKNIDSSYVIKFGDKKLKVQYVNPLGRFCQVFLSLM